MQTLNDVHQQFAYYFNAPEISPYLYLLSRKLSEGSICISTSPPDSDLETLPPSLQITAPGTENLVRHPLVGNGPGVYKPFILYRGLLYLHRYFSYETRILERITSMIRAEAETKAARAEALRTCIALLPAIAQGSPRGTTDWQLIAVISAALNDFSIITGGPGTGKTTTVSKLLTVLYTLNPGLRVALAAPTGRAGARMAESLRNTSVPVPDTIREKLHALVPSTIHRLLKPRREDPHFRHNAGNPLTADVVIVDECSMVDVALFCKLLEAVRPGAKLILLGDKDQLAAVEAGSLFGDLCRIQPDLNRFSGEMLALIRSCIPGDVPETAPTDDPHAFVHPVTDHITELRTSHRFSAGNGIGKLASAVIRNERSILGGFISGNTEHDGSVITDLHYSRALLEQFAAGFRSYILEPDTASALRLLNRQRVLCAVRQGEQGLHTTNRIIEQYLQKAGLLQLNDTFYRNRPVILTRNYYEFGLFNGDTGIVREDPETGILKVYFEQEGTAPKGVLPAYLSESETAFAMTIHKSQGSEFDEVMVILPAYSDTRMLSRELLYTGITRARKRVLLQAAEKVLYDTAERQVERASGITGRLLHDIRF